jgi:hypothetical protein
MHKIHLRVSEIKIVNKQSVWDTKGKVERLSQKIHERVSVTNEHVPKRRLVRQQRGLAKAIHCDGNRYNKKKHNDDEDDDDDDIITTTIAKISYVHSLYRKSIRIKHMFPERHIY